ncbi:hypothetical protein CN217_24355 [Sinorhizobium meliloti]|nr:hypothetical protein CN217_24350 [Sinorhizobium meliloti]RVH06295.1 hypothetical protein CN217_24355 [Sinorhizobium meliloti]
MILIQLRLGFVPALTVWCDAHFTDVPWMLPGRLGALGAQFCQVQALKRLEASVVMLIGFLRGGGAAPAFKLRSCKRRYKPLKHKRMVPPDTSSRRSDDAREPEKSPK